MRALTVSVSLACVVALGAPRRAGAADPQRVAVVRLTFEGGVTEAARELFAQRLAEGLAAAQFRVMPRPTVRERLAVSGLATEVAGCRSGPCFGHAAAALGVDFMVVGTVAEQDKSYDIALELVNGQSGTSMGVGRERCEICGIEEASEKVGLAASALRGRLEALAQTPARFVIRSRPAGARVTVDGHKIGRTPVDHELPAGVHKLALVADGYDGLERTVTAVSGVDESLDLDLVPLPTKFPYRVAGWSALVAGVAAVAVGVWAFTADGKPLSCPAEQQDANKNCPYVRDNRALGLTLVGLGGAASTLGVTWIYLGSAGAPRPGDGGGGGATVAGVTVGGRF